MVIPAYYFEEGAKGNVNVAFDTSDCVVHDGGFVMAVGRPTMYQGVPGFDAPAYMFIAIEGDPAQRLTLTFDQADIDGGLIEYFCGFTDGDALLEVLAAFDIFTFDVTNGQVKAR